MKRVLYAVVTILEILCFAGAYVVNYFTRKKMGMARFVIYKNRKWEAAYPLENWKYAAVAVIAVLAVITIILWLLKKKQAGKMLLAMNVIMIALAAWYVWFTLGQSKDSLRAFYFMSPLLGLSALLQIIKTLTAVFVCRRGK